jgi:hypothetical protein
MPRKPAEKKLKEITTSTPEMIETLKAEIPEIVKKVVLAESNNTNCIDAFIAQARRYMETMYGLSVWYRAPETLPDEISRWALALGKGDVTAGEAAIAEIERTHIR